MQLGIIGGSGLYGLSAFETAHGRAASLFGQGIVGHLRSIAPRLFA